MTESNYNQSEKFKASHSYNSELLLHEYEEIGQCWRHDDQTAAQLTTTLFPLALGALLLPYAYPKIARSPVALGGIFMMAFWLLYYLRMESRFVLRFQRAKEIEKILGFEHHLRFEGNGLKTKVPSITKLRIYTFIVYCVIWTVLLIWF
jgi:hypothetical protein